MVPGVRSSLVFSGFGHKPPASGVQSYSYSRLLHLYSTDDKTSRLKMKSFSTLRDTQRGSLRLQGEEKMEGVVRGNWNEMR